MCGGNFALKYISGKLQRFNAIFLLLLFILNGKPPSFMENCIFLPVPDTTSHTEYQYGQMVRDLWLQSVY